MNIFIHIIAVFALICLVFTDAGIVPSHLAPLASRKDAGVVPSPPAPLDSKKDAVVVPSPPAPLVSSKALTNGTNFTVISPTLPPPPVEPSTTPAPVITTTVAPDNIPERKFDGASFIGGIVLCAGLTAIGFVSWEFYKARMNLTYRTL